VKVNFILIYTMQAFLQSASMPRSCIHGRGFRTPRSQLFEHQDSKSGLGGREHTHVNNIALYAVCDQSFYKVISNSLYSLCLTGDPAPCMPPLTWLAD
jgi:hypothetical protein